MYFPCSHLVRHATTLAFAVSLLAAWVDAHGAMTYPRPRNALDGDLPAFTSWAYPCDAIHKGINCTMTFCGNAQNCQGSCAKSAHDGIKDSLTANNGQACYW